jgi:signal transduction histidine kinase
VTGGPGRPALSRAGRAAVLAALLGYVVAVYLVVVVVGEAWLGGAAAVLPTFVAAALVAVTLEPVRLRLRRWWPTSAQDRLARLSARHSSSADVADGLQEMARLVGNAVGAIAAEITVDLGSALVIAGRWPAPSGGLAATPRRGSVVVSRPITRGALVVGTLTARLAAPRPLTPVEERLLADAARHAALLVDATRLDQALRQAVDIASTRRDELRRSRQRILAEVEQERRRIEQDMHDGAQQHLVALLVHLRLLRVVLERDPARGRAMAVTVGQLARTAVEVLDELSRGMYPPLLLERGAAAAVATSVGITPRPQVVDDTGGQRWAPEIERALYFSCVEALQNAAKHAGAARLVVTLSRSADEVRFDVTDDGRGFDVQHTPPGSGTFNMRDRLESVGGLLSVASVPTRGTTVSGRIPVPSAP